MKTLTPALAVLMLAAPVHAGKIERACNNSDRNATRAVCSCIQDVADKKLSRSEQKMAARFFKDPQLAQDTRQSDDARLEKFWKRYKLWGQTAAKICG